MFIDRSVIFIVLMEWYSIYSTVFFQCGKGKCLTLIKNDLYVKVKIQPMDIFTNNGLIMTIFVLRAQPITFYAASQLVQPKYLGYTVAIVFPLTGLSGL